MSSSQTRPEGVRILPFLKGCFIAFVLVVTVSACTVGMMWTFEWTHYLIQNHLPLPPGSRLFR